MNKREIALLLSFASTLDGRVPFDEAAVEAWALVLEPSMEGKWAHEYSKRHYGTVDTVLIPSVLNKGWQEVVKARNESRWATSSAEVSDRHCRRSGCQCTHTESCYMGWIDGEDSHKTSPCPICREPLADVLSEIAPLGFRGEHDYARIRNRFREDA